MSNQAPETSAACKVPINGSIGLSLASTVDAGNYTVTLGKPGGAATASLDPFPILLHGNQFDAIRLILFCSTPLLTMLQGFPRDPTLQIPRKK